MPHTNFYATMRHLDNPTHEYLKSTLVPNHPTSLGKRESQGDAPCTPAGEIPCTPFTYHLRCFCTSEQGGGIARGVILPASIVPQGPISAVLHSIHHQLSPLACRSASFPGKSRVCQLDAARWLRV